MHGVYFPAGTHISRIFNSYLQFTDIHYKVTEKLLLYRDSGIHSYAWHRKIHNLILAFSPNTNAMFLKMGYV